MHRNRPRRIEPASPVMPQFEATLLLDMTLGKLPFRSNVVERVKTLGLGIEATDAIADRAIDEYFRRTYGHDER